VNTRLRDWLLAQKVVSGVGTKHDGLDDIYANLLLVDGGVRPAFMVQYVDYKDQRLVEEMLDRIEAAGYEVQDIDEGAVVFKGDAKVLRLLRSYDKTGSSETLGKILGYPAAHDFPGMDRSRSRLFFSWEVSLKWHKGYHQVMANVFRDKSLVEDMESLALRMSACLEPKGFDVMSRHGRMR
jgi:hypothetical protein